MSPNSAILSSSSTSAPRPIFVSSCSPSAVSIAQFTSPAGNSAASSSVFLSPRLPLKREDSEEGGVAR
ncbi:unnamed protein product [Calypogeia fissa]